MAARGLVNGRGPCRRNGRDSAKRVVLETIAPVFLLLLLLSFDLMDVLRGADAVELLERG